MLGGSHGYNSNIHVRGNKKDFDDWKKAGNPSWEYDNVVNYFKKSEGMQVPEVLKADKKRKYHNTDGPLKINGYHNTDIMRNVVMEATNELGYKKLIDINAKKNIGIAIAQGTLDKNRRCTTAKAFLVGAKNRTNLYIIKKAHVTKLNFDEAKKKVTGIQFIYENRKMIANARKEVVLCAGAINTPQLLMLSGIGPKKHLQQHQIETIVDLPVGKNLQDHPYIGIPLAIKKPNDSFVYDRGMTDTLYKHIRNEYGINGNGMFDLIGFFNTQDKEGKYPDIQTHYIHMQKQSNFELPRYLRELMGYDESLVQSILNANRESAVFFALTILLNPKSAGEIRLRSNDPFDHPIIDANYLANEDDLNTILRGIRFMQKFLKTEAYRRHQIEEIHLNIPECDSIDNQHKSDAYYKCIIRHIISTLFHPTGMH